MNDGLSEKGMKGEIIWNKEAGAAVSLAWGSWPSAINRIPIRFPPRAMERLDPALVYAATPSLTRSSTRRSSTTRPSRITTMRLANLATSSS